MGLLACRCTYHRQGYLALSRRLLARIPDVGWYSAAEAGFRTWLPVQPWRENVEVLGNVIDPFGLVERYGLDQLRYFLMREVPFGQDGSYSHDAIVNRTNADLANDLGNLAQRSLSMIAKNCEGKVPVPGEFSDADKAILDQADAALETARKAMDDQALHLALGAIFAVVAEANRYFAGQEPWALRKTDPARMGTVLYVTAEVIRRVGIMVQPFIPQSAEKLLDILAIPADKRQFSDVTASQLVGVPICQPRSRYFRAMWKQKNRTEFDDACRQSLSPRLCRL